MLSQNTAKSLLEFGPENERLITAELQGKHGSITVVQCYAPTKDSSEEEKDQFYSSLRIVVELVPTHDVMVVMSDLNAMLVIKTRSAYRKYDEQRNVLKKIKIDISFQSV